MIPGKRKSSGSSQANSPPAPSRISPVYPQFSPPHRMSLSPFGGPSHGGGPLSNAAAAVAAFRQTSNVNINTPTIPRRTSGGTVPPSRQGSAEVEREVTPQPLQPEEGDDNVQPQKDDGENDDDEKDDMVVDMDAHMQAQMEKAKEDMKLLLDNFSEDQIQRYEGYRRSALNRTNVKRLVGQVLNQQCSPTMAFVVAGFTKVYVGEIVEKAREVMEEWGHTGAIRPEHLREAHRRYKKDQTATTTIGRKLFRR